MTQPQPSETRSEFPFFGGEKTLVVTAPDHPEAKRSRRFDEPVWSLSVIDSDGEEHGLRGVGMNATADTIWRDAFDVLYQTVSSSEVDRRSVEIEAWVTQVYAAYHARAGTRPD